MRDMVRDSDQRSAKPSVPLDAGTGAQAAPPLTTSACLLAAWAATEPPPWPKLTPSAGKVGRENGGQAQLVCMAELPSLADRVCGGVDGGRPRLCGGSSAASGPICGGVVGSKPRLCRGSSTAPPRGGVNGSRPRRCSGSSAASGPGRLPPTASPLLSPPSAAAASSASRGIPGSRGADALWTATGEEAEAGPRGTESSLEWPWHGDGGNPGLASAACSLPGACCAWPSDPPSRLLLPSPGKAACS
mmetsp:Transcript_135761/g.378292  ORF Transcript_135761/g.378292 Transcript_135761/m.378292 type:complete len:246 (-) Transcript_135761:766-1503(-)